MKKSKAGLIKFGATGVIECINSHLSGAPSDPETFCKAYQWWADPNGQLSHHWDSVEIPAEGLPVLDIRTATETKEGYSWVFRGPLLNLKLSDGEIDRLPEVDPIMAMPVDAYGMTAFVADTRIAQKEHRAGSLDGVSLAEYLRGWKEHGARTGWFTLLPNGDGQITWDK